MAPIEARHGPPEGALFATAFRDDILTPAITGAIDDDEWRARITTRLTAEYGEPAARNLSRAAMPLSCGGREFETRPARRKGHAARD